MARKSRKRLDESVVDEERKVYQTAVYVRLSVENSGKADDGISFENQKKICLENVREQSDLQIFDLYEDNGEKGTDVERPEFQRMLGDIRAGRVNCVVVKDLSRFSRNYIDAGNYLEKVFPFLEVRFISITDHYDSLNADGDETALMIPLKNMINTAYAKDISRKIITSFRARQENCEVLPSFGPYGYVKSETRQYRYEIDEKTAPFVRKIFRWTLEGKRWSEIIRLLNEQGAITPAARKLELGIWHDEKYAQKRWSTKTITDMLRNPTYTGCIVYGRMITNLAEGIPRHWTDNEDWRIFPNMHEALVTREEFEQVQKILREKSEARTARIKKSKNRRAKLINPFEGKIVCGDCGNRMRFLKQLVRSGEYFNLGYACGRFLDSGTNECSRHSVRLEDIQGAVMAAIMEQTAFLDRCEKMNKVSDKKAGAFHWRKLTFMKKELEVVDSKKMTLYEEFIECKMGRKEYEQKKKELDEQAERLEKELKSGRKKLQGKETVLSGVNEQNGWAQVVRETEILAEKKAKKVKPEAIEQKRKPGRKRAVKDRRLEVITKELIEELVDQVIVYEGKRVEIRFRYAKELEELEKLVLDIEELEQMESAERTEEFPEKLQI